MFKVKTEDQFRRHIIGRLQVAPVCLVAYKHPIVQFTVARHRTNMLSGTAVGRVALLCPSAIAGRVSNTSRNVYLGPHPTSSSRPRLWEQTLLWVAHRCVGEQILGGRELIHVSLCVSSDLTFRPSL